MESECKFSFSKVAHARPALVKSRGGRANLAERDCCISIGEWDEEDMSRDEKMNLDGDSNLNHRFPIHTVARLLDEPHLP